MKPFTTYTYIFISFVIISSPFIHHYFIPKYEFIKRDDEQFGTAIYRCNKVTGEVKRAYTDWYVI